MPGSGTVPSLPPPSPASATTYAIGVGITVLAVVSQYFVPVEWPATRVVYGNLPGDLLVVYGIPIATFALLLGAAPLRAWRARLGTAAEEGLRWYGALSILALGIIIVLAVVYEAVDPSALSFLNKPNPALQEAQGDPWFFVGFSFVVGAIEETIFRGWIFGYWARRSASWVGPAAWTSAIFAGVHLYYGFTYGPAAPLIFPTLFLIGFAFAATYRLTGGNLVVVALLHGENDASAYLTIIPGFQTIGVVIHYLVILVGGLIALLVYLREDRPRVPVPTAPAGPGP